MLGSDSVLNLRGLQDLFLDPEKGRLEHAVGVVDMEAVITCLSGELRVFLDRLYDHVLQESC